MKRLFFIIILIFIFFSSAVISNENKILKAASDPWPPFIDPQNPKGGLCIEIARAAYATQGYKVEFTYRPWARAMAELKFGKIDIIVNTWITEERKKFLMYSDPYATNEIKFIKLKNDKFEFNGIKSLNGKKIGIIRGYGYGDEFNNATNFASQEASNLQTNIKKLIFGRIDLTLEDEIVARISIKQKNPHFLKKIEFTKNSLSKRYIYLTSGLKNPKHKEYINAFNKGLKIIKNNGTFDKIMEQYGIK